MTDAKKQIYRTLKNDTTLMNLLAYNAPFANPDGSLSKGNSLIPFNRATASTKTPFITIQAGNEDRLGQKFYAEDFYIRAYNATDASYETINSILNRIQVLLDNAEISLVDGIRIVVKYTGSLNEMIDEPVNLNFRESKYQVSSIQK